MKPRGRSVFFIIILLLVTLACNKVNKKDLNQLWVGKYQLSYLKADTVRLTSDDGMESMIITSPNPNALYIDTLENNWFIDFKNDSLVIVMFNETVYGGYRLHESGFAIQGDTIFLLDKNDEKFSMLIEGLNESALRISYHNNYNEDYDEDLKMIFQSINKFELGEEKNKLDSILTSSQFEVKDDSSIIEFTKPSRYISGKVFTNDLKENFRSGPYWHTTIFDGELFLIIGHDVTHISEINKSNIKGINYELNNKEFLLTKTTNEISENLSSLYGTWERVFENKPAKEASGQDENYSTKEILEIQDSIILKHFLSVKDTLHWGFNKFKDKIVFKDSYSYEDYSNIIELKEDKLVIQWLRAIKFDLIPEFVVFERKQ